MAPVDQDVCKNHPPKVHSRARKQGRIYCFETFQQLSPRTEQSDPGSAVRCHKDFAW